MATEILEEMLFSKQKIMNTLVIKKGFPFSGATRAPVFLSTRPNNQSVNCLEDYGIGR